MALPTPTHRGNKAALPSKPCAVCGLTMTWRTPLGEELGRSEVLLRRLPARKRRVAELRTLIVVLGDQLDLDAAAFDDFDADLDAVWMAEVAEESTHVWSSKPRTVMFLAAMRHFALALQACRVDRCITRNWTHPATAAVWPHSCRRISSACGQPPGDDRAG